jgi:hypothetical protein
MPQAKQIVLTDDQSSEISFDPNNIDRNGVAHFLADSTGQLNLAEHLALSVTRSPSSVTAKASLKLETVKTQTSDGIELPVGKAICELNIKFPSTYTTGDRARTVALLQSAFSNSDVKEVLTDLKSVF